MKKLLNVLDPRFLITRGFLILFMVIFSCGIGVFTGTNSANPTLQSSQALAGAKCSDRLSEGQVAVLRHLDPATMQLIEKSENLSPAQICTLDTDKLETIIEKVQAANGFTPADDPDKAISTGAQEADDQDKAESGDLAGQSTGDPLKFDSPEEYLKWYNDRQRGQNGVIDPQGLLKAKAQVDQMQQYQSRNGLHPNVAGVTQNSWTWDGPGNIGGRIRAIVIDPTNPLKIYIGAAAGGIWKTTDGGASWTPLGDFLPSLAVSSLVMDPTNPAVIYAGSGEGFYNGDSIRGAGIFKTTDGGTTWTQLPNTNNANFYYINRLAISQNGLTILAATNSGMQRSTNAGSTWSLVQDCDMYNSPGNAPYPPVCFDVQINPQDDTKAVASGIYGGVFYSIDSGATWTLINTSSSSPWDTGSSYNRVSLAYAPSNPLIVYASHGSGTSSSNGVWKSTDGGASYTRVSSTSYNALSTQSWYANTIAVNPLDPTNVFWAGLDIYRSTDSGVTFTKISDWTLGPPLASSSAHADHHAIIFDPQFDNSTNKTAYFTNDGGIFKAVNTSTVTSSSGWTNLNNGLGITQFYGGAGNPTSGKIIAGAQDNGTLVYSGNPQKWTPSFGGDGGYAAADPTDPNYFYGEYVFLNIHRSTNAGSSSSYIYSGISDANSSNAAFIAPFVLDPNNPSTMLAGGNNLWRSTNVKAGTPSWSALGLPTVNPSCETSSPRSCITAVAVATGNSDVIWVGRNTGQVYFTTNGTAVSPTWNTVTIPGGVSNRSINWLTIDPNNSDTVYAGISGYQSDTLYRITNNGATWTILNGSGVTGLPNVPVFTVAVFPGNSNWLYVGTPIGMFASEDGGTTWQTGPADGPNNAPVDELTWVGSNKILAVTHGRGLYETTVVVSTCANPTVVTLTSDTSSCGTLRNVLTYAGNGNSITFDPTLSGPIVITSPLPNVKTGVTITGNCDPVNGPTIVIDGTGVSGPGLNLLGHNTLSGLIIRGFSGPQIHAGTTLTSGGASILTCVVTGKNI